MVWWLLCVDGLLSISLIPVSSLYHLTCFGSCWLSTKTFWSLLSPILFLGRPIVPYLWSFVLVLGSFLLLLGSLLLDVRITEGLGTSHLIILYSFVIPITPYLILVEVAAVVWWPLICILLTGGLLSCDLSIWFSRQLVRWPMSLYWLIC